MELIHAIKESLLPSGRVTSTRLFYLAAAKGNISATLQDDLATRAWKGMALFIASLALHFLSFFGAIWFAYGSAINGLFYLICDLTGRKTIFSLTKNDFLNRLKASLIQGLFSFAIYFTAWWVLGIVNALSTLGKPWLHLNGIEWVQTQVDNGIKKIQIVPPRNSFLWG